MRGIKGCKVTDLTSDCGSKLLYSGCEFLKAKTHHLIWQNAPVKGVCEFAAGGQRRFVVV